MTFRTTLAAIALSLLAGGAQATTLTFDTVSNGPTYTEAGATISAEAGSVNVNTTGSALGFDCCAGAFTAIWSLTTGDIFDLISVYVEHVDSPDPVSFSGYLSGVLVATTTFTGSVGFYNFSGFTGIDQVVIGINSTAFGDPRFDSLTYEVAPIPLPAALPLMLVAVGGIAALRRPRR